jgi:ribosome-associated toxin RatA of RatAB toxin-antitoxin module
VPNTSRQIAVAGDPDTIYDLLADLGRWPRLLPHVREVHVADTQRTEGRETSRIVYERFGLRADCTCRVARDALKRRLGLLHVYGHGAGLLEHWEVRATSSGNATLCYGCAIARDSPFARVAARVLVIPLAVRTMDMVDLLAASDRLAREYASDPLA